MIEVDGDEGGGQLVRSSLTLAMLSGEAVRIEDVRGNRSTPGLQAQHLTVVETAAEVCDAEVDGADIGSETVEFDPGTVTGGSYEAAIGTAGSVTLLFDAFLPLATTLDDPIEITATGGTDVKWSPPMAYYRRVKLPLLRDHGLAAAVDASRTGYYPAGGGRATLRLWPSTVAPLELADPGPVTGARVYSKASDGLADSDVAERQAETARETLAERDVAVAETNVTYADSTSPGSVVVVRLDRDGGVAGFDAYGEPGTPAEAVAEDALEGFDALAAGDAAVDAHLADQLLVVLAIAGGAIAIPRLTDHVTSSLSLLASFGRELTVDESRAVPVVRSDDTT